MGIKMGLQKTVEVEAKTIKLHCKVRDNFTAELVDAQGSTIHEYDGYVPSFFPGGHAGDEDGNHYGDYLILDIDLETGQIMNWKKPSGPDLQDFVKGDED